MNYELHDTLNRYIVSSHNSLLAARKAQVRHKRAVKKATGKTTNAYIPTAIRRKGNLPLTDDEVEQVMKIDLAIGADCL